MAQEKDTQRDKNLVFWGIISIAFVGTIVGFFIPPLFPSRNAEATQSCSGESGNLEGTIMTDNMGDIYLSKESWDTSHPSNPADVDFYVSYNTETGVWSGRGWNENVGWVDFNYDQQGKKVRFVAPGEEYDRLHDSDPNNDEPVEWGNWRGVADLSAVSYSVQDGHFYGKGHDEDGTTGDGDEDETVGSGEWSFEKVNLFDPVCPEQVHLLFNINGTLTSEYHKDTCPIGDKSLILQWTSEGVHDCKSIAGPWDLISRPSQNTGTDVRNTDEIDGSAVFKMECKGDYTGVNVVTTVSASCGENGPGDDDDDENNGIVVPKIIEV